MGLFGKIFKKDGAGAVEMPAAPQGGELDPPPLPDDAGSQTNIQNVEGGMDPGFAGLENSPGDEPIPEESIPEEPFTAGAIPDTISAETPPDLEQAGAASEEIGDIQEKATAGDIPPPPPPGVEDIEAVTPFTAGVGQDKVQPIEKKEDIPVSNLDLNADIEAELRSIEGSPENVPQDTLQENGPEEQVAQEETTEEKEEMFQSFEAHPFLNVIQFRKIVEVMNTISNESKIAEDAISRIEEINHDMETRYKTWQQNLEDFEKKIIKIDSTIYKG